MTVKVEVGQPITLPDGTEIHPGNGERGKANIIRVKEVDEPEFDEETGEIFEDIDDPFKDGLTFKRTLADLPANARKTNPLMLVLAYNMWGLDATSISMLLNITDDEVNTIMCDDLFVALRKDILESIRYSEMGSIHGYLTENSLKAARTIVKHMRSKDGDRSLTAAKDVLDRSGFRPSDRVEHVHKFEDELRIVYVKEQTMPTIELNFKEISNGNGS